MTFAIKGGNPAKKFESFDFDTPPFKPRKYEGEYISYTLYGLDSDGDELEDIISSTKKSTVVKTIKELLPDYRRIYNGMHVVAILYDENDHMLDSVVVWSTDQNEANGADEGPYTVYSLDDETGRVSKDGVYPTWRKAYAALADGTVWDEGSSNNFVFHGNHLQQIYKYKKTGRTGKWSGNGYDVIFDREISEDPADYIKAHFTPTRYNACRFNESKGASEKLSYEKGHKNSKGEDAPWVIRSHKDDSVLASFPTKKEAENHMRTMKRYSKTEDASSVDDLSARHNQKWLVKVSYDVDASHSAVAPSIVRADTKDAATNIALKRHRGLGYNMKVVSVEPMTESRKKSEAANDIAAIQDRCDPQIVQKIVYAFTNEKASGWPYHPFSDGNGRPRTRYVRYVGFWPNDYRFDDNGIPFSNKEMDVAVDKLQSSGYYIARSSYNPGYPAYFTTKNVKDLRDSERVVTSIPHYEVPSSENKNEGRFTEIKAAIKAAWSAAEAKWFRLDFQESTERLDVYPIASDNEGVGVNWGVLPERNIIAQYATDLRTGNNEIEREMPYKDLDELEEIFVDEFKSMDETLEVGADNGADIHPLTESAPKEVNTVLKKNAPKLIDILNAKFKAAGFDVALKLADPENASFSDGWYLDTKSTGKWDTKSRMFNLRLAGTEYNGVVYKDGNIYLKKGARPASNRGVVVHPFGVGESRPTEREVDNFLHNALDWASIDDGENRVILKFIADAGKFALIGYDGRTQKTLASGELFSVVDRFRELVEMDQADAIREFEKE